MVAPELDRSVWGHLVGRGSSEPPKCRPFSMTQCGFRVPRFFIPRSHSTDAGFGVEFF